MEAKETENYLKPVATANVRDSEDSKAHRRRGSSVGNINLGDTSPGLSTMRVSKAQRQKSTDRVKALSKESSTDRQITKKLYVAFRELTYRQTWVLPLMLLSSTMGVYYISDPDTFLHKALEACIVPSYKIEGTDQYGKGGNDFYLVFYYTIFFTFLREFCMCLIIRPWAEKVGIRKGDRTSRFMEQGYSFIYYSLSGSIGLWIMSRTPIWFFNTTQFYVEYPHKTHDFFFKSYYLGQASFWVQQSLLLILQVEKPRKDFYELVFHHVVTIALIWNSYRFHFTWMGLAVFITMDVSDVFLACSKLLNYLDSPLTAPFFAVFMVVWIYLRHYINLKILWSVLTEFKTVGEWELNWITQQYKCWISQPIVFGLIGALQLVNMFWLFLIVRIMWRVLSKGEAKDDRSDDEDEGEDTIEDNKKAQ